MASNLVPHGDGQCIGRELERPSADMESTGSMERSDDSEERPDSEGITDEGAYGSGHGDPTVRCSGTENLDARTRECCRASEGASPRKF